MRIGVLAVQGAFIEHINVLKQMNIDNFEIRKPKDISEPFDGLILPGGESTTMGKLLVDLELFALLKKMIDDGLPVFGTCAGLILLAKKIVNEDKAYFSSMNITIIRNAYGRQLGSFNSKIDIEGVKDFPLVFIRAPYISSVGDSVTVLATLDNHIIAAREKNMLVTSFHPELSNNNSIHNIFINMCKKKAFGNYNVDPMSRTL